MVQLGLCAFRAGYIADAHSALHDIWVTGHFRELLAQVPQSSPAASLDQPSRAGHQLPARHRKDGRAGVSRAQATGVRTKSPPAVRFHCFQIPFHMHINTELFESVYLVCSMLIEVPSMVQNPQATQKVNRQFRRHLNNYGHQHFTGLSTGVPAAQTQPCRAAGDAPRFHPQLGAGHEDRRLAEVR